MEDVYFRRYPRWINDSREWGFISSFTGKVSFKFAYRPSTIPLRRYQITTIPYTNNNGHGPGHHSHILLAALQQLRAYCSLLTSISIPASISNSYALHRYRLGFTATKSCLLPATGSTFLSWSGVTLWSMLVSLLAPLLLALVKPSVLSNLIFFIRCIASYFIRPREREKEVIHFSFGFVTSHY